MRKGVMVDLLVILVELICVGYSLHIRLSNPSMTEIQLIINYFDKWIVLVIVMLSGYVTHAKWGE